MCSLPLRLEVWHRLEVPRSESPHVRKQDSARPHHRQKGSQPPSQKHSASDGSPRDYLVQRFPSIPAARIEAVLSDHGHDLDASMAQLVAECTTANCHGVTAADWFEQHQRDESYINALPDDEFKRKLSSLRMSLMSDPGSQGRAAPRVVPAERIAAALHYSNCSFETAKNLLLENGAGMPPCNLSYPFYLPPTSAASSLLNYSLSAFDPLLWCTILFPLARVTQFLCHSVAIVVMTFAI